jgi:hypothetical protein
MAKDTVNLILERNWNTYRNVIAESAFKNYYGKQVSNVQKEVLKILLENTKRNMITEGLTTSAQASVAVPVILGLTKKFFPKLIANEIVSVQPLTRPTGIVKFKKIRFGDGSELASEKTDGLLSTDTSFGTGQYQSLTQQVNVTLAAGAKTDVVLTGVQPPFKSVQKGSFMVRFSNGATVPEVNGVITAGNVKITVDYYTGKITVQNLGSDPLNETFDVIYNTVAYETNSPDMIGRVFFDFENIPVHAVTRKLKASWTYEFLEDVQAELGDLINFEQEAFEDVSAIIAAEINREIIMDIISGVLTYGNNVVEWHYDTSSLSGNWLTAEAYFRTLIHKINEVAGKITRATKRFEPNFIVVSPYTKQFIINGLTQYEWRPSENVSDALDYAKIGFAFSGTISGKWNMYVTPSIPDGYIIVGYKGSGVADSGYVYAPYIPLKAVPITYESIPGLYFYTRYGKAMYSPWYYGVVRIPELLH